MGREHLRWRSRADAPSQVPGPMDNIHAAAAHTLLIVAGDNIDRARSEAAWAQAGVRLTAYSYVQAREVRQIPASDLQPGDLLFFFKNGSHHASMYIGLRATGNQPHPLIADEQHVLRHHDRGKGWETRRRSCRS